LTKSGIQESLGQRLQAERKRLGLKAKELAGAAEIPIDSYRKYEGDSAVPGGGALAGLARAGVRVEYLLTGVAPVAVGHLAEPAASYQAVNVDLMSLVLIAVDRLLPEAEVDERASLVALAYDYMMAKRSTDSETLAAFLRHWAKSSTAQPPALDFHSPAVAGEPTPQRDLFKRREEGADEPATAPAARGRRKARTDK